MAETRALRAAFFDGVPAPARRAPILAVDSDDDTRALYRASFALSQCEVIEASDGREALTHALRRPS
jgi:CheY-like chemotaxis protein